MNRIPVKPDLLKRALERARLDTFALAGCFPKLTEWGDGALLSTVRHLGDCARIDGAIRCGAAAGMASNGEAGVSV